MANWLNERVLLGVAVFIVLASLFWGWSGGAGASGAYAIQTAGQACVDGDNGYNLNVASSCTWTDRNGMDHTIADTCTSSSTVYEAFCSPSLKCGQQYMLCRQNQQCVKGRCV